MIASADGWRNIPPIFEFDLAESVIYISFAKFFAYLLKDCKSVGQ